MSTYNQMIDEIIKSLQAAKKPVDIGVSDGSTFVGYVDKWEAAAAAMSAVNSALKFTKDKEMAMRRAIRDSVGEAMGETFKEGTNNFKMADGRTVKVENKLTRTIDEASIADARKAYAALNDRPVEFDEVLRVKYEINKKAFDKMSAAGSTIVKDIYTTKQAAPTVKVV